MGTLTPPLVKLNLAPKDRVIARRILTIRYTEAIRKKHYESAQIIKNIMAKLKQ